MQTVIFGAGHMGRRHVQVVRDLGLTLAGVCDRREEALSVASAEQGVPAELLFTDAEQMLSSAKPECVIVATTAPGHCPLTCLSAESGARFILCEKPMATSLEDCDRMIEVCRDHEARLSVNHQMRFMEQYLVVQRIIESSEFGGLSSISVTAGNFGMAMNGTHYFELFRWLTGEDVKKVTAWFSADRVPNPRGTEFEDRAGAVRLSTASGKRFYMDVGADQGHGAGVTYAGGSGILVADELSGEIRASVRRPEDRSLPTTRYAMPSRDTVIQVAPADSVAPTRAVLEALINDADPPTGEDGRSAVAVLAAAYSSHEQGHVPVRPNGNLPRGRVFPWA